MSVVIPLENSKFAVAWLPRRARTVLGYDWSMISLYDWSMVNLANIGISMREELTALDGRNEIRILSWRCFQCYRKVAFKTLYGTADYKWG